ncbi:MAG: lipoyl(octanoyl) transferase LipB [Terriglobia bacterium]
MAEERKNCGVMDWGVVPYAQACAWQAELVARRQAGELPDLLILCEHPAVITLGRNARRENVQASAEELAARGVEVHTTKRGGDVTYHGPGQLVGYPIIHLGGWHKDVVAYVRALEEVLMRAVREFGVEGRRKTAAAGRPAAAGRRQLYTGVWVGNEKLAAIGVHIARWVTSHGFALNVTTDLSYFDFIVPCGIADKRVTSLERLLALGSSAHGLPPVGSGHSDPSGRGRWVGLVGAELMAALKAAVVQRFGEVFERQMTTIEPDEWEVWLGAHEAAAS